MTFFQLTEIGWAGEDVAEVVVVHVFCSCFLNVFFELLQTSGPSSPAGLHVAVLLHGNDAKMVLLVDPYLYNQNFIKKYDYESSFMVINGHLRL